MNIKEEFYIRTLKALIQHNGYYEGVEARALEITNRSFDVLGGVSSTPNDWIKWDFENDDVPEFPEGTTIEWRNANGVTNITQSNNLDWFDAWDTIEFAPVVSYRIIK